MGTLATYCEVLYETTVPNCVDTYVFSGLTAATDYVIIGTDVHGHKYDLVPGIATSSGTGDVEFTIPLGHDSKYGGGMKVQFYDADAYTEAGALCTPEVITICTIEYNGLHLNFINNVLEQTSHTILCPC